MIRRIALAASLALASTPLYATTYTLEPDYTQGIFRWNHLGFSSPAAQFSQGEGTLEFDQADPTKSSVKVTIPLASLNTGVPALDDDFRSEDFFNTARFPTATFRSTKVEKGVATHQFKVTGDLSLHGVTKPVTLDVTITKIGANPRNSLPTVGFDGETTLKRSDFGLQIRAPSQRRDPNAHHQPGSRSESVCGIPESRGGGGSRSCQGRGEEIAAVAVADREDRRSEPD